MLDAGVDNAFLVIFKTVLHSGYQVTERYDNV